MSDLYDTLGVNPSASADEIKAAGRKAQKAHHPDMGGDAEKFRAVTNALVVLLDPEKKDRYDKTGEADFRKGADVETNMAMDVLAQMIARATDNADPRYLNLPREVGQLIEQNIESLNSGLRQYEERATERVAKLDGFLKRMKRKRGHDMIAMILTAERDAINRELALKRAHTEKFLRINSMALEMLADYEYATEAPPQGHSYVPGSLQEAVMREAHEQMRRGIFG